MEDGLPVARSYHDRTLASVPVSKLILSLCFFLSLLRATNIGLFYPADEMQLASIDYSFQTALNYILLLGLVAYVFFENNYAMFKGYFTDVLLLGLGISIAVSLAISFDLFSSIKNLLVFIVVSLPSVLYVKVYGIRKMLASLNIFIIVMCFVNLAYVLVFPSYGIMSDAHEGRWRGMFEHKNGSGPFFAISFFILLHHVKLRITAYNILILLSMAISVLFVVMAQSSTALVALASMAFLYPMSLFIYRLSKPSERIIIFLIVSALLFFTFVILGPMLEDIFFALTGKDATLTGRTNIWAPLIEMSLKKPFFGYGFGMAQEPEFISQIHGELTFEAKSTHNSYLDIIISTGYPALIMFLLFVLRTAFNSLFMPVKTMPVLKSNALGISMLIVMLFIAVSSGGVLISKTVLWLFTLMAFLILKYPDASSSLPKR